MGLRKEALRNHCSQRRGSMRPGPGHPDERVHSVYGPVGKVDWTLQGHYISVVGQMTRFVRLKVVADDASLWR